MRRYKKILIATAKVKTLLREKDFKTITVAIEKSKRLKKR